MPTSDAPVSVARAALTVNDLAGMARFYEEALGLRPLASDGGAVTLGAGGRALLELRGDRRARRPERGEAGLFHTAFLLPSRGALGAWARHAAEAGVPLSGASDHLVSEALYLDDPEGNGIEVYRDRPRAEWPMEGEAVRMATLPLDLEALAGAAEGPWAGAPEGTVVGHVHLKVGDPAEAERFWGERGFAVMARYPGAAFLATGGYHHHLGANAWSSRGAGRRTEGATGLAELVLEADAGLPLAGTAFEDPWGTRVRVEARAA